MLLEQFDANRVAVINPEMFIKKIKGFPKTAVSIFNKKLIAEIEQNYKVEKIAEINSETKDYPVYKVNVAGREIAMN